MIDEEAAKGLQEAGKGLQEIAKGVDKSADALRKVGALVDRTCGSIISNSIGLISDRLAYFRLEKAIELADNVERKLKARGVDTTRYVPVNFGLPLIEKATVEEDPTLSEKWANLLSNARDPNKIMPNRSFVSILADLEPIDASILDDIVPLKSGLNQMIDLDKLSSHLNMSNRNVEISVRNLQRLGLVKPGVLTAGVKADNEPITIYKDLTIFEVTEMGIEFYRAVSN